MTKPDRTATLRLLVPDSSPRAGNASGGECIELLGQTWRIQTRDLDASTEGEYVCLSYAWGKGKSPHPWDPSCEMSDRTMGVAESLLRTLQPKAIWVDAFCVPLANPERARCLKRMGAIYGGAFQVVVALSRECAPLLEQSHRRQVEEDALLLLERDEWVTRAWTYQEIVNSRRLSFIAEGCDHAPIDGQEFLNHVSHAIMKYKQARHWGAFELRWHYPRLDSIESLVLDWRMSDYLERSVYQVLSSMHGKVAERPGDHFRAMLGAVIAPPLEDAAEESLHPAERFMRVCEEKKDFSFIYSTAARDKLGSRAWRPVAGELTPLFSWPTDGKGQHGSIEPNHLRLEGMVLLARGSIDQEAAAFIDQWLSSIDPAGTDPVGDRLSRVLQQMGFSGSGGAVELTAGYFFPQLPSPDDGRVAIATGVTWLAGALGLMLQKADTDGFRYSGAGVFVGKAPKSGIAIEIAH